MKTAIAVALPLLLLFGGCATKGEAEYSPAQNELAIQRERIAELAVAAGIPEARARRTPPRELLRDIESQFKDAEMFSTPVLTRDELKLLDSYLDNKPGILKTIRNYDRAIRRFRNRRIIVLPEERGQE